MEKRYRMKDLGIETLIGREVLSAGINEDKDMVVLETDKGPLFLTWEGDCCSRCFLANVSGVDALVGAKILEAENAEWNKVNDDDDYEVIESMGTKLKTTKGYVTLESRLEHNGYYSGSILVSDDEPMNQYHSPRYDNGPLPEMKPLADF
jgi:hypothetical protein